MYSEILLCMVSCDHEDPLPYHIGHDDPLPYFALLNVSLKTSHIYLRIPKKKFTLV